MKIDYLNWLQDNRKLVELYDINNNNNNIYIYIYIYIYMYVCIIRSWLRQMILFTLQAKPA